MVAGSSLARNLQSAWAVPAGSDGEWVDVPTPIGARRTGRYMARPSPAANHGAVPYRRTADATNAYVLDEDARFVSSMKLNANRPSRLTCWRYVSVMMAAMS